MFRHIRVGALAAAMVAVTGGVRAEPAGEVEASGAAAGMAKRAFDAPEAIHWHAATRSWFVSSLGGGLNLSKDGVGWITRLDEQGRVVDPQWVAGLHAPTGISHRGQTLYVADRDGLLVIDVPSARVERKVPLPGATFPNDTTVDDDGNVYVSDFQGDRIYRWRPGQAEAEVWLEDPALDYPNGLWADGETLYLVTWGPMTNPQTFETSRPGVLKRIDLKTKSIEPVGEGKPVGNFDGVVKAGEHLYATDWMGGRLIRYDLQGRPTVLIEGFRQLADPGYAPELGKLGVPEMSSDRVFFVNVGGQ